MGADRERVVVPQRAVSQVQNIASVWVIRPDSTAEYRRVELGDTVGEEWIVQSGIEVGEMVATTGLQKLRNGAKVCLTTNGGGKDE